MKENIKKNFLDLMFVIITFFLISLASIIYASLSTSLTIIGSEAMFRPDADIRIVDFRLSNLSDGGSEEYNSSYGKNNIKLGIILPELTSTVTYEITVTNFVDIKMLLEEINNINFNNDNIEYELVDMQVDDIIDGITTKIFSIKFKYKDSVVTLPQMTNLGANLEFIFVTFDNTPPVITDLNKLKSYFITETDTLQLETLVSAIDDIDGDITNQMEILSLPDFDKNEAGTYTITYNVKDKAGNKAIPVTIEITIWKFIKIVNGQYHGLALGSNGTVWTWGWNSNGQRGIGSSTTSAAGFRSPTRIDQSYFGNLPVIDIATGFLSSFALNSSGQAYAWGQGASYQLGNNSTSDQISPIAIPQPNGILFTQISSFYQTGAGLGNDGNIYTWGYSLYGANGTSSTKNTASAITSSGDFIQVSQGYYGGAAVNNKGQVYVWGTNLEGELGAGNSTGYNHPPTLVSNVINNIRIKEVSYGLYHILALTEDGMVYAWGSGSSGKLCLDSTSNKTEPELIVNLNNVSLINAGYDFSQFKSGNNIYSCGYANYGELFAGNITTLRIPYLSTMNNVVDNVGYIAGRYDNAYILSKNGAVLYGIGYCDTIGQEFGSNIIQTTSTSAVVPWTFTPLQ